MDVEARVKQIIAAELCRPESEIKLDTKFIDDLGADSLDLIDLVMFFEDEYNIEISDEDAEKLLTVGDVVNYIKSKKGA